MFIYEIDPATCAYKPNAFGQGVDVLVIRGPGDSAFPKAHVEAFAIHPITGDFYVAGQDANGSSDTIPYVAPVLYKISRTTGEVVLPAIPIPLTDGTHPNDGYAAVDMKPDMQIEGMSFDSRGSPGRWEAHPASTAST